MPQQERIADTNQFDDGFGILNDILKKEEQQKPPSKYEKFIEFISRNKKYMILSALLLGLLILAFIFLMGSIFSKQSISHSPKDVSIPPKLSIQEKPVSVIDAKELEKIIKKANFLYIHGNKKDSLHLYEEVSKYSEGLSHYNLGVVQMQEKSYGEALQSFQKAIDVGENRVISALNAAVCSLYLKDDMKRQYYLQLAEAYLPYSANFALYSYFYALLDYYKGYYIEAISPLSHQETPFYSDKKNALLASLYAYFDNNRKAIETLNKNTLEPKDWFNLALLYARIGEYQEADNLLSQTIDAFGNTLPVDMALLLVKLKLMKFNQAAGFLNAYADNQAMIDKNPYPIQVILRDDFFDINVAQKRFWNEFRGIKLNAYGILFYYAPYKVFDVQEAINIIKEGGRDIFIENLREAKEVLLRGQTVSRANQDIARAILESINGNVRNTNAFLTKAVKNYPNHSILHYNLGLNYAQMGDYDKSYRHFIRSFHLDPKDIYAGIFALITAKLTHRDSIRLEREIAKEMSDFKGNEQELEFLRSLLSFVRDGFPSSLEFLDQNFNHAIYYAFNFNQAILSGDQGLLISSANRLKEIYPNDPLSNLLVLLALNYTEDVKFLSLKLQSYYQDTTLNKETIYYGPAIAREMYIKTAHIAGTLHYVAQELDNRLIAEQRDVRGITQALALTYLYLQEFEKAFTLYNALIDDLKENDTQTLFLAAVAAIGAGHTDNAAALLQLSKLEAPTNYETRLANGLLFLQEKNFHAAASQFSIIGDVQQQSDYFDFKISPTTNP